MQEEIFEIETPERVAFGYEIAGIGSRFIAALVDTAFLAGLQVVVFGLAALLIPPLLGDSNGEPGALASSWLLGIFGLLSFGLLWGYYIFFEMIWNGQSPGKRLVRLRVVRADGTPITLNEAVIRNLVRLVDFLPLLYGVGVVTMFVDARARRLGDLAAGTLVVRDRGRPVTLDTLSGQSSAAPAIAPPVVQGVGRLPIERLEPADLDALEAFYHRRNQFTDADVVGGKILQRLFRKMDLPLVELDRWETARLLSQIRAAAKTGGDAEPPAG